jgi:hypothetical protein
MGSERFSGRVAEVSVSADRPCQGLERLHTNIQRFAAHPEFAPRRQEKRSDPETPFAPAAGKSAPTPERRGMAVL